MTLLNKSLLNVWFLRSKCPPGPAFYKSLNCVLLWHSVNKIHTLHVSFMLVFLGNSKPTWSHFYPNRGRSGRWVGVRAKGGLLDVWTGRPSRSLCGTRHNLNPQNSTVLGGIFLPSAPQELFQPQTFSTRRRRPPRHHQSLLAAVQLLRYITHRWSRGGRQKKTKLQLTTFE